jgi:hypothetical protein
MGSTEGEGTTLDNATLANALIFHVVTFDTREYPGMHVVRKHAVYEGHIHVEPMGIVVHSLDEARACVPSGLSRLPRDFKDDPVIVESWL